MQAPRRAHSRGHLNAARQVTPMNGSAGQEVREIPLAIRRAGAWSWRLLVLIGLIVVLAWGFGQIPVLVISVLVAILLAAMLNPLVNTLTNHTFLPRAASAGVALIGLIIVVVGMFVLAGRQLMASWDSIAEAAVKGFNQLWDYATTTLNLDNAAVSQAQRELLDKLQANTGAVVNGALTTAGTLANATTGVIMALFTLFFLLSGGAGIWRWIVGLLPSSARSTTHEAFRRGWKALSAYIRTQILVAGVDATGIALGLVGIDVFQNMTGSTSASLSSYAVPIWLIVFLFSFIPLVGAIISGAIACLLALVLSGFGPALVMLVVTLAVNQLESNVLQPLIMGKAVQLHPLAVFLGVAAGATVWGVPGALFAIPVMAFLNAMYLYLTGRDQTPELGVDEVAAAYFAERDRKQEEFEQRTRV